MKSTRTKRPEAGTVTEIDFPKLFGLLPKKILLGNVPEYWDDCTVWCILQSEEICKVAW